MTLQVLHDTIEEIPEAHRELYTEEGGKFKLTGISGVKTQADIDNVSEALRKEKEDHKDTKGKLRIWDDFNIDDVTGKLDQFDSLKIAAEKNLDEEHIEKLVEARTKSKIAPFERELKIVKEQLQLADGKVTTYEADNSKRAINDAVFNANKTSKMGKIHDTAMDDAMMLGQSMLTINDQGKVVTKDNVGVTPGVEADVWFSEMTNIRPHWFLESKSGGAKGGDGGGPSGSNPWSSGSWNITQQGQYIKQHGMDKAKQMAKSVGSMVGAIEAPVTPK
jgi:hypothetical protein